MSNCIMYMLRQNAYGAVVICAAVVEQKGDNFYLVKPPTSKLQDYKAATTFMNRERFMTRSEYKMLSTVDSCMYGRDLLQLFRAWNNVLRVDNPKGTLRDGWCNTMDYIESTYSLPTPRWNDDNLCVSEDDGHVFGIVCCELNDFIGRKKHDIEDFLSSKLTGDMPLRDVEYEIVNVEPNNALRVYVSGKKASADDDTVYDDIHFDAVVNACNGLKEIYTVCDLIINDPSEYPLSLVGDAERTIDGLNRYLAEHITNAAAIPELEKAFTEAAEAVVPDSISNALNKLKEEAEQSDVWYLRYGDFWNEVPTSHSLYDAFTRYADKLSEVVPGMLGAEESREDSHYDENTTALSIYDLSDFAIVFMNEASAEKFIGHYEIDPVDMMFWTGNSWQGA